MALFSKYKGQRIVSLWHDRYNAPTIVKILEKEKLLAARQGIQKFLKKYEECGSIGRREGASRKTKINAEGWWMKR